jgi:hypothetical protein
VAFLPTQEILLSSSLWMMGRVGVEVKTKWMTRRPGRGPFIPCSSCDVPGSMVLRGVGRFIFSSSFLSPMLDELHSERQQPRMHQDPVLLVANQWTMYYASLYPSPISINMLTNSVPCNATLQPTISQNAH